MIQPGRSFKPAASGIQPYRYGFNSKEKSEEVAADNYDFGARIYDGRIGRWLSTDPVDKSYITPFNFSRNNPTNFLDPDGEDEIHFYYTTSVRKNKSFPDENSVKKTLVIQVVPKEGPDMFVYHKVKEVMSAKWVNKNGRIYQEYEKTEYTDVPTEFFPNDPFSNKGITSSSGTYLPWSHDDPDYVALSKLANDELLSYLDKKDHLKYGGLGFVKEQYEEYEKATQIAGIILLVGGIVEGGVTFIGAAGAGEALAARTLLLEEQNTGAHFFSRHGAETSLSSQYTRAISGLTPDGVVLGDVNASRFLTNEGQLNAVNKAKEVYGQTGKTSFTFDTNETIGEGYLKGGGAGSYRTSTQVQAVFKNGQLNTLYPLLKK
jgi:RHS repeat-associated protein